MRKPKFQNYPRLYIKDSPFPHTLLQQNLLSLIPSSSLNHFHHSSLSFSNQQREEMKHLIRRLSRVADSANYSLLRSDSQRPSRRPPAPRRSKKHTSSVPEGHVPVYVGDEMERFVVSAELLNHPVFIGLLNRSAQEYGYEQKGVLQIPCHVLVFERIMESLRLGLAVPSDLQDVIGDETIWHARESLVVREIWIWFFFFGSDAVRRRVDGVHSYVYFSFFWMIDDEEDWSSNGEGERLAIFLGLFFLNFFSFFKICLLQISCFSPV